MSEHLGSGAAPHGASVVQTPYERLAVHREQVEDLLGELAEIAHQSGINTLEREVREERLPALQAGRISVVVLGEFNHGKSTVINALLGEAVLPMGITPTTAVITHLVHGETPRVLVKPAGQGHAFGAPYEDLAQLIRHTESLGLEPEYVEIAYPNPVLGDSLMLVDTPGVNDISRQKVEITYGYVPKSDVILYVLDATQVLKKSEVTFIRDRLLRANRERIIFVLGKIDALTADEAQEVESYARARLEELIGPVELYAFSARNALEAQRQGQAPPAAFVHFRDSLFRFLGDNKAFILVESALGGALRIAAQLEQNLAIKRQGYRLESDELARRIQAVHARLADSRRLVSENLDRIDEGVGGIAATARHNLRVFTEQFREQLPLQIERAESKDIKRYLHAWIEDRFKDWLEQEGQHVARHLETLAEEVIEVTNASLRDVVEGLREEMGLRSELNLEIDTMAYDVSVFALGTLGVSVFLFFNAVVGGLLTLAAPVLAFFLKGKHDEMLKERARDEGLQAIQKASERIEEELLAAIHTFGARLKEFVETAGERLYRQIEEVLERVQTDVASQPDREILQRDVEAQLQAVARLARMIQANQRSLRGEAA